MLEIWSESFSGYDDLESALDEYADSIKLLDDKLKILSLRNKLDDKYIENQEHYGDLLDILVNLGKIDLIIEIANEYNIKLSDGELDTLLNVFYVKWEDFLKSNTERLSTILSDQFNEIVSQNLGNKLLSKDGHRFYYILLDIFGYCDCIEMILMGCDKYFPHLNYREKAKTLTDNYKTEFYKQYKKQFLDNLNSVDNRDIKDPLKWLNKPWMPERFWWYHVDWTE